MVVWGIDVNTNATSKIIGPHYAEIKYVRKNVLNDVKSRFFFSDKSQSGDKSQFIFLSK